MKAETAQKIADEVARARAKHPQARHLVTALMEELGALAQAYLQGQSKEEIEAEAVQVAAVAVRIIEEGDSTFDGWRGKP